MKRYQVFISSTYEDLKDERLTVLNAILSIDCFPAGMELFSAASEEQFSYIKKIIEQSDYYVLIIGGRYGSTDENGISYTEKEFDYAVKMGVPVLAYVRKNVEDIPAKYVEQNPEGKAKLEKFKEKVQDKRLIAYWNDKYELSTKVITGLEKAFLSMPRMGMVRIENMNTEVAKAEHIQILVEEAKKQEVMMKNLQNEIEKNRVILESFNLKKNVYASKGIKNRKNLFKGKLKQSKNDSYSNRQVNDYTMSGERFLEELIRSCEELSKTRCGALIVVEKNIPLIEYINTGIYMDCIVSNHVLRNIFERHTPLHDGAVIIRGTRLVSATCYLPLTDNFEIAQMYGTRHRAAIGISEVADCVTIVVSEETGNISITYKGKIYQALELRQLRQGLIKILSDLYSIENDKYY